MNLLEKLRMFNRELAKENARLAKIYDNMCESAAEAGEDLEEEDEGLNETVGSAAAAGAGIGAGVGALAGAAYGKLKKGGSWKDAMKYGAIGAAGGAALGAGGGAVYGKFGKDGAALAAGGAGAGSAALAAKDAGIPNEPIDTTSATNKVDGIDHDTITMPDDTDTSAEGADDVDAEQEFANSDEEMDANMAKSSTTSDLPKNDATTSSHAAPRSDRPPKQYNVDAKNAVKDFGQDPSIKSAIRAGNKGVGAAWGAASDAAETAWNGVGKLVKRAGWGKGQNESEDGMQDFDSFVAGASQNESEYSKYHDDRDPDTGYVGPIKMSGAELFAEEENEDSKARQDEPTPEISDEEFFSPVLEGSNEANADSQIDDFFSESVVDEDDILTSRPSNGHGSHNGHIVDEANSIPAGKFLGLVNEMEAQDAAQFFQENDDEMEECSINEVQDEDADIPQEQFLIKNEREQEIDELDKGEMMDYEEFYGEQPEDNDGQKNESLKSFKRRR